MQYFNKRLIFNIKDNVKELSYLTNLKVGGKQSLAPNLLSRNNTLVIAARNYGETDIWFLPILLDLFFLFH